MNIIINGTVQKGMGVGKQTGFKTSNLEVELAKKNKLKRGLYSCNITIGSQIHSGLLYYGLNSISNELCLEIHILNFDRDIYGQNISVIIREYMREEMEFESIEKLKNQLQKDIKYLKKSAS